MNIKEITERNRWQVDFGTKIPLVLDPDGNGRRVGRRTSRFKSVEEAKEWARKVLIEERLRKNNEWQARLSRNYSQA
jgi:hypothetical protein